MARKHTLTHILVCPLTLLYLGLAFLLVFPEPSLAGSQSKEMRNALYDAADDAADKLVEKLGPENKRIAVIDEQDSSWQTKAAAEKLKELIGDNLDAHPELETILVARGKYLEHAQKEMGRKYTNLFDESTVKALGNFLGADTLIVVQVIDHDASLRSKTTAELTTTLIVVETARQEKVYGEGRAINAKYATVVFVALGMIGLILGVGIFITGWHARISVWIIYSLLMGGAVALFFIIPIFL